MRQEARLHTHVALIPSQAVAVEETAKTGIRAIMTVPWLPELISKVPPSCRNLSRIPLIPTPGVPPESIAFCFFSGMPRLGLPVPREPARRDE
jgi:hypothetical protein